MSTTTRPDSAVESSRSGRLRTLLLVAVLVIGAAVGGYWFVLRPSGKPAPPEPGEVVTLEPIQINLAAGHYLRIGIALQLTAETAEVDGSRALDATIRTFSGLPIAKVDSEPERAGLKKQLTSEIVEKYHDEVMDLYFVEFVTQ